MRPATRAASRRGPGSQDTSAADGVVAEVAGVFTPVSAAMVVFIAVIVFVPLVGCR